MYLEALQKNYGKGAEYSKEFFDQAQRIVSRTECGVQDPNALRDTPATRDQITADLAKGDPAAISEIQALLSKLTDCEASTKWRGVVPHGVRRSGVPFSRGTRRPA